MSEAKDIVKLSVSFLAKIESANEEFGTMIAKKCLKL